METLPMGCNEVELDGLARSAAAHGETIEIEEGPTPPDPTLADQRANHVETTPMDTTVHPEHVEPTPQNTTLAPTLADEIPKHVEPTQKDPLLAPTLADEIPKDVEPTQKDPTLGDEVPKDVEPTPMDTNSMDVQHLRNAQVIRLISKNYFTIFPSFS